MRNNHGERARRQRRSIAEEGGAILRSEEDVLSPGLTKIGKAFAIQSARSTTRALKQSGPSSAQINKFVDEIIFPVIINLHCEGLKSAEDFKRVSKEASDLKFGLEKVKQALAQTISTQEGGSLGHHRPVIDKIIGLGFTSERTFRNHLADWVTRIQTEYKDDFELSMPW
jgi:hypothetical protein